MAKKLLVRNTTKNTLLVNNTYSSSSMESIAFIDIQTQVLLDQHRNDVCKEQRKELWKDLFCEAKAVQNTYQRQKYISEKMLRRISKVLKMPRRNVKSHLSFRHSYPHQRQHHMENTSESS